MISHASMKSQHSVVCHRLVGCPALRHRGVWPNTCTKTPEKYADCPRGIQKDYKSCLRKHLMDKWVRPPYLIPNNLEKKPNASKSMDAESHPFGHISLPEVERAKKKGNAQTKITQPRL